MRFVPQPRNRFADFILEFTQVVTTHIFELGLLEILPDALDRVQVRSVARGGQTGNAPSSFAACQRGDATGARPGEPFADGTLGDAQGRGNLLLRPALLIEFPGAEPTTFAPIGSVG